MAAPPGLPAGPPLPAAVQAALWLQQPVPLLRQCRARYGDPFTLRISGWGTLVMLSSPDSVRSLFQSEGSGYRTGEANELMTPLVGTTSVFVTDGAAHRRARQALVAALRRCAFPDLVVAHEALLRELRAAGTTVRFQDLAGRVTLEVIARAALGVPPGPGLDRVRSLLRLVLGPLGSVVAFVRPLQQVPGPLGPGARLRRAVAELDGLIAGEIARRRAGEVDGDLLSALVELDDETAGPLTPPELRDQLVSVIAAANDTVATAFCWAAHWVARDPAVAERLAANVVGVDPTSERELAAVPYLGAVVSESLRLSPVVELMSRATEADTTLLGYQVPAGTLVSACSYLTHHDPAIYDAPDEFRPERFLARTYSGAEFYPFGGGLRRCIGAASSVVLLRSLLCTLVQVAVLRPAGGRPLRAVRRNVILAPARRTPLRIAMRPTSTPLPTA